VASRLPLEVIDTGDDTVATPLAAPHRGWLARVVTVVVLAAVVAGAAHYGLRLREFAWRETDTVRFRWDIQNGLNWGRAVLRLGQRETGAQGAKLSEVTWRQFWAGYVGMYGRVTERRVDGNYRLDYTPLRLLVMSLWAKQVYATHADAGDAYEDRFTGPLLAFNAGVAGASAVFAFALVAHWLRRGTPRGRRPVLLDDWAALFPATAAALLLWFNPAVITNAHVWPQWDTWLLPFFLVAALLASTNWWLAAGMAVLLGSGFKGQILLAAPIFVLWPVFRGHVTKALRFAVGFAFAAALQAWVWLLDGPAAWWWVGATCAAMLATILTARWWRPVSLSRREKAGVRENAGGPWHADRPPPDEQAMLGADQHEWADSQIATAARSHHGPLPAGEGHGAPSSGARRHLRYLIPGVVVVVAVAPWLTPEQIGNAWAPAVLAVLAYLALTVPRRIAVVPLLAGTVAATVLLAGWRFDGCWAWYDVGYEYGTRHFMVMHMGAAANLPGILSQPFNWAVTDRVPLDWNAWWTGDWSKATRSVEMRSLLQGVYFALVGLVAVGLSRCDARNDSRGLVGFVTPFVLLFAIVAQMHERYLTWGAAACALLCGVSWRAAFAYVPVTLIATMQMWVSLFANDATLAPRLSRVCNGVMPHAGWALLTVAVLLLTLTFPRRRPRAVAEVVPEQTRAADLAPLRDEPELATAGDPR
jgi:hypothetical protein